MLQMMDSLIKILFFIVALSGISTADRPCQPRAYNHSSIVCVCNAEHCDDISRIIELAEGEYVLYSSSMSGKRFEKTEGSFTKTTSNKLQNILRSFKTKSQTRAQVTLEIDRSRTFQAINGFGGSFTDAAGINILKLSDIVQGMLIDSYFSEKGLEYNMARVPISGCDFSTHPYAYNMYPENDTLLSNYSLTMEDYVYKIPMIKRAQAVATDEIFITTAAWSPPLWMKTNNNWGGDSRLREEYYQTWADYHLKFLEEYDKENIKIWAMSTGNEPSNGIIPIMAFNSLGWLPSTQAKWLAENLGPTIRNSRFADIKLMTLDDQIIFLPWWVEKMAENPDALQYLDGIAMHWYWSDLVGPAAVEKTHALFPDKFLLATEACVGDKPWQFEKVELGSWERAEMYIDDILKDLNHWFTGWIDWNLALDRQGGPNWFDNYVDAPIIVMPENDEFLKQPLFYAMGHFSKFIPRRSVRVAVNAVSGEIDNVAFWRQDGGTTMVFYNQHDEDITLTIRDPHKGTITVDVEARSVHSLVYW